MGEDAGDNGKNGQTGQGRVGGNGRRGAGRHVRGVSVGEVERIASEVLEVRGWVVGAWMMRGCLLIASEVLEVRGYVWWCGGCKGWG